MIKVSVLYPKQEGSHFDMDYYCATHMPMAQRLLAPAIKGIAVEHGICGGQMKATLVEVAKPNRKPAAPKSSGGASPKS